MTRSLNVVAIATGLFGLLALACSVFATALNAQDRPALHLPVRIAGELDPALRLSNTADDRVMLPLIRQATDATSSKTPIVVGALVGGAIGLAVGTAVDNLVNDGHRQVGAGTIAGPVLGALVGGIIARALF